ncbi:MAG: EsaB/YukD family protein [Lachnospiraceae bacterium]|jgi:uncharacterized ubiquitin-like protein YukD|nr:EsaB/YukD family protein [Lachnospiraceae bacterium]
MAKAGEVNITLIHKNKVMDLRIPLNITLNRFEELVAEVYREKHIELEKGFTIKITNKRINIEHDRLLSDFPISDGDTFLVE